MKTIQWSSLILDPGVVPEINRVTRFPFQDASSDAKIPTIMYYNALRELKAVGAEAQHPFTEEMAQAEGWTKYSGKTFVQETHHISSSQWSGMEGGIQFILSHLNGWEGEEQNKLKEAMISAGLISSGECEHLHLSFVTEGEASLYFCLNKGLSQYTSNEDGFMIVDAGGGMVDISTYIRAGVSEGNCCFQEIAIPQYKLKGTAYAKMAHMIADCFDKTAKLQFRNAEEPAYIQFGTI
ncbi:hypothetical protein F5146DRAFT_997680 [Armillaria mellea]|nr:hypothetical protein F5146DRAFT_997680 [Armillaria mellea]